MSELYSDIGDKNLLHAALHGPTVDTKFERLSPLVVSYIDASGNSQVANIPTQTAYLWTTDLKTTKTNADPNLNMNSNRFVVIFMDSERENPQLYAVQETDYITVKTSYDIIPLYYLHYRDWEYYQIKNIVTPPSPINGIVIISSFNNDYADFLNNEADPTPGGIGFGSNSYTPFGAQLGCSENQIASDFIGRVCTINGTTIQLTFPLTQSGFSTDISSSLFSSIQHLIPHSELVNPLGIFCDGGTWYVLTELLAFNGSSVTFSDYGLYVVSSTNLTSWNVLRTLYSGYGTSEGIIRHGFSTLVFDQSTGELTGVYVDIDVRFSNGTTTTSYTIPADPSLTSPQSIYANKDGTMTFGSGDFLVGTLAIQAGAPTYGAIDPRGPIAGIYNGFAYDTGFPSVGSTDPVFLTDVYPTADVINPFVIAGNTIGFTDAYNLDKGGLLNAETGATFPGIAGFWTTGTPDIITTFDGFVIDVFYGPWPFFSYGQGFGGGATPAGGTATLPSGWYSLILAASQTSASGTGIEILAPDRTLLSSSTFSPSGPKDLGFGQIYMDYILTPSMTFTTTGSILAPDVYAYGVGGGGTIIIIPYTSTLSTLEDGETLITTTAGLTQIAYGSHTPVTLDANGQTIMTNIMLGQGNTSSFIRFSENTPSYIWCYNNNVIQGTDQAFTSFITASIIDPSSGIADVSYTNSTVGTGNEGIITSPSPQFENVCGDGGGGIYTIDYVTGNLLKREGPAGTVWEEISLKDQVGCLPPSNAVVLIKLSTLFPGFLLLVYGTQFQNSANYMYISLKDYSIANQDNMFFPIFNGFGVYQSGSQSFTGGFFTTACEVK